MIVLHAAPLNAREIGGPHVSVPALIAAQRRCGDAVPGLLLTGPNAEGSPEWDFPVFARRSLRQGRIKALPAPFCRPDLVVLHGTYLPVHERIARQLRAAAIPYVVCPRGGMTRFAQQCRWWKKRLANLLFFNRLVAGATAIHCLTQGEAEASRGWGRPVFVVGNGTDLPPRDALATPGRGAGLRLVFVGRLEVKIKGLDLLLEACARVRAQLQAAGVRVELYGPDHRGSVKTLAARIDRLGLQGIVALGGTVAGEAKHAALRSADVFLHPSRSEGHPMAVLEALAHGVPCLLTPNTNMAAEVATAGAGWQVEPSAESIAAGLAAIVSSDRGGLAQAGIHARRLAATEYDWSSVARRTIAAYRDWTIVRRAA